MDSYPEEVERAFHAVYYGGQTEQAMEAFKERWRFLRSAPVTRPMLTPSSLSV